ncbi:MAG TPA: HupE/UreJ family protein [Azospirillum sp.]|nr:HupE/UreJ family protein [Azospirillum sp.]
MRLLFALLLLVLGTATAAAHVASLSTSRVTVDGETVRAELSLNPADLVAALKDEAALEAVLVYLDHRVGVSDFAGRACPRAGGTVADGLHVEAVLTWRCAGTPALYRATPFQDIDPSARHLVVLPGPDGDRQAVLDSSRSAVPLADPPGFAEVAGAYLLSGVEHIFLGYDHVAFLLAVILWARGVRALLAIVTGFTLAHSVTLGLAAMDVVSLPSDVVEPLVAASIVFVAAENYLIRNASHRWWVATLFGLVHGFAFAGVLGEMGLPQGAKLTALVFFNLGVELGQIAIVLLTVPLLAAAERRLGEPDARRLVYGVSGVLLVLGLYWFVDRLPWA